MDTEQEEESMDTEQGEESVDTEQGEEESGHGAGGGEHGHGAGGGECGLGAGRGGERGPTAGQEGSNYGQVLSHVALAMVWPWGDHPTLFVSQPTVFRLGPEPQA